MAFGKAYGRLESPRIGWGIGPKWAGLTGKYRGFSGDARLPKPEELC
jgi:hypothetical protein